MDDFNIEAVKAHIRQLIEESPVIATCQQDCDNDIRQAEVDLGTASDTTCSTCVLHMAASILP